MLNRVLKNDAELKKHQINTLKIFNDKYDNGVFVFYISILCICYFSVTEVNEGEEYEVSFESGGNILVLKVYLSSDFPQDKPTLKIVPPVVHAWINADGEVISAPGLLNVRLNF